MLGKPRAQTMHRWPSAIERAKTPERYRGEVRICQICGLNFHAFPAQIAVATYGRFCSRSCKAIGQRRGRQLNCEWCGKSFWASQSSIRNGRKFCRDECARAALRTRRRRTREKYCPVCGDPINDDHKEFCSETCHRNRGAASIRHGSLWGYSRGCRCAACISTWRNYQRAYDRLRKTGDPKGTWRARICMVCGCEFNAPNWRIARGEANFCGRSCAARAQLRNNGRWRRGSSAMQSRKSD